MSKKKAQKGISLLIMLLLVMVSPTIVLSSDKIVGLANAQSANQTSSGSFPPPTGGGGGPGFGPPQFSAESIGTVAANQTCSVTPSIVEEEEEDEEVATTPQATEGPYFCRRNAQSVRHQLRPLRWLSARRYAYDRCFPCV
jgi:hypothetical protein